MSLKGPLRLEKLGRESRVQTEYTRQKLGSRREQRIGPGCNRSRRNQAVTEGTASANVLRQDCAGCRQ